MSAAHTEGLLYVAPIEEGRAFRDLHDEHGKIVSMEHTQENARRLAACWNACEGLDTEKLEALPTPWSKILAKDFLAMSSDLAAARALLAELMKIDDDEGLYTESWGALVMNDKFKGLSDRIRAFLKGGAK